MDIRQLQHFVAVAQEMHFSRAAVRLNIVQSALSASVSSLEQELDVRLFHRTTRKIRLTSAGEVLLEKALLALAAMREAERSVASVRDMSTGSLMIGTVQSLPTLIDLPALLSDFHAIHPGIELRLRQGNRLDLAGLVLSGELDLAFVPFMDVPSRLERRVVVDVPMVLACAVTHPLADRDVVALSDLAEENFVDFQPGWGTRSLIDRYWEGIGTRATRFEVSDLATQLALVERGLGVALVPESNVKPGQAALRTVPLQGTEMRWRMLLMHRREEDAAVDAFLALAALQASS
ncbi:MAG: hypothetical protein BGO57_13920 [Sphingomonadales bacterium 63-6]|nr:MAG: hypothetical protein BGO57_13920 [Sphingomonadales bacterium 63-6]